MLAAEVPKITDWMQAWGSLAGLLMSTFAVVFTGLLLRHEIRVRREEQRDGEAAQARLVVGSVIAWEPSGTDEYGYLVGPAVGLTWRVKNYSSAPIFDVEVALHANWDHDLLVQFSEKSQHVAVVEEKEDGHVGVSPIEIKDEPGHDLSRFRVIVNFTDASGVRWKRHGSYPPERLFDFHPPTKATIRRNARRQRLDAVMWNLGRWRLWIQVRILRTRKPEELEAYGTKYDPIPF